MFDTQTWRAGSVLASSFLSPKHLRKTTTQECKKSTSGWGVLFKKTSVQAVLFPSPEPEKKRPQPLN